MQYKSPISSIRLCAALRVALAECFQVLCAVNGVTVLDYRDSASGVMEEGNDGSGEFVRVTLRPRMKVSHCDERARALALHNEAHRLCFIARSVRFPVDIAPEIMDATAPSV